MHLVTAGAVTGGNVESAPTFSSLQPAAQSKNIVIIIKAIYFFKLNLMQIAMFSGKNCCIFYLTFLIYHIFAHISRVKYCLACSFVCLICNF